MADVASQLEDVLDLVTQNAGDAVPSDAADMEQTLAEASSPCAGCKVLASEVFKEAAAGSPDKLWVEAMVECHGKGVVRAAERVRPAPLRPLGHVQGHHGLVAIGNTPADPNYMVAGVPRFGGASFMRSTNVDVETAWPPSANASYDASAESASVVPSRRTRRGTGTAPRRIRFPIHR